MDLLKYEGHEDYWGLEDFCKVRLRELTLFSLEKRLQGDLIAAFQYIKGAYKKDGKRFFARVCSDRTRINDFKGKFRLDLRKKVFIMRLMRHWNGSPEKLWTPHPLKCSKPNWTGLWVTSPSEKCPCPWQRAWNQMIFQVLSNLNHSVTVILRSREHRG